MPAGHPSPPHSLPSPLPQHGNVETDESWYPTTKSNYEKMDKWSKLGRLLFPFPLFAYPFYVSPPRQLRHRRLPTRRQRRCQLALPRSRGAPGMEQGEDANAAAPAQVPSICCTAARLPASHCCLDALPPACSCSTAPPAARAPTLTPSPRCSPRTRAP